MKKIVVFLAISLLACDGANDKKNTKKANPEEIEGSCNLIRVLTGPIETSNVDPAFGYTCTHGSFGKQKATKSWCETAGKVIDRDKKFLKFTPNGSCDTSKAVAVCSGKSGSSIVALYHTPPYNTEAAKKGLESFCEHYNYKYLEN